MFIYMHIYIYTHSYIGDAKFWRLRAVLLLLLLICVMILLCYSTV